jgi:phosphate transport system permease protein
MLHSRTSAQATPDILIRLRKSLKHGDRIWNAGTAAIATLVLVLVFSIGAMLWVSSEAARKQFGLGFVLPTADYAWNPVTSNFQAWPFIYGTLVTSLLALVLAVPVSLGVAIFLAELSPAWLRGPVGWMIELLVAIPSVIYGLWGVYVFLPAFVRPLGVFLGVLGSVPGFQSIFVGPMPESGSSLLAASFVLAIMITPTITAITRDVFLAISADQREASLALGATRAETILRVLVPYGGSGILGAIVLGLGRALGETMAVTMVIGNSLMGSYSLLQPGYSMASVVASQFLEATDELHVTALIEVGLVLFFITLLLNIIARWLVSRIDRQSSRTAGA